MAKGQKRSSREAKKPKTSKKKHDMPSYLAHDAAQPVIKGIPEANATKH